VPPHECLHAEAAGALRRVEQFFDPLGVSRHRLLAQDVLARPEGTNRPFDVERVRERDVDHLESGIGEQLLVRAVRLRDVVVSRVRHGARELAAGDG
jgi:hypothetical protein